MADPLTELDAPVVTTQPVINPDFGRESGDDGQSAVGAPAASQGRRSGPLDNVRDQVNEGFDTAEGRIDDFVDQAVEALAAGNEAAAAAILEAAGLADERIREFFAIAQKELRPFIEFGVRSLPDLDEAFQNIKTLTLNPEQVLNEPGVQFGLREGAKARERLAAASGRLFSGRTLKEVDTFAQGFAGTQLDAALNRRNNLFNAAAGRVGVGSGAATSLAGLANSAGANLGQLALGAGQSLSSILSGEGTQLANTFLTAGNQLGNLALGRSDSLANIAIAEATNRQSAANSKRDFVGNIIGTGIGAAIGLSDARMKEHVRPAGTVLPALAALPVYQWQYKDQPGVDRIGPMAQDVNAALKLDPKHASGNLIIDLITMNGVLIKAVQELNEKVEAMSNGTI